jgi:hypothetical protein
MYYTDSTNQLKNKLKLELKRGLMLQVVLFHCALCVVNNLQIQQWLQKNQKNHSHLTSKGAYYFKWLLESQNKQSKAFVKKSHSMKKLRKKVT